MLDLGCGLGSVLLMMAWRFPEADVTGIEAQADRAAMGRRSIAWNGAESRCRILDGDLRDPNTLPQGTRFPLITGTPPYFPQGTGPKSEKTHAAACRFETRGGIEDYALAAARWLTPGGRFVVCTAALEAGRVVNAAREAGLKIIEHVDVVPREGKDVLVMVDVMGSLDSAPNEQHGSGPRSPRAESRGPSTSLRPNGPAAGEAAPPARDERRITVRDAHAQWTPDFQRLREAMGFPPLR